jgi:hypothetical protein
LSVKLDDLDLSKKNGSASTGLHELRTVNNITILDKRSVVEIEIPGKDGNILQDMGREPAKIIIVGELMGEKSRVALESMISKADENKPCQLATEKLQGIEINKVLIEDLSYEEIAGTSNRYSYRIVLKEFIKIE